MDIVFSGSAGASLSALAVCEVEGGPSYQVVVQGEASALNYKVDKDVLDFGRMLFNVPEERDFIIQNNGKVPVTYAIDLSKISRPGILEISSLNGALHFPIVLNRAGKEDDVH